MLRITTSCILAILIMFALLLSTSCRNSSNQSSLTSLKPQQPLIASVTPSEVKAGSTITVAGSGFGADKAAGALTIGGVDASTILSWSDTEIQAVVPTDAMTGTVKARVEDKDSDEKDLVVLWDNENPQNVGIVASNKSPLNVQLLPDGKGGVFIVWNDFRDYDPYTDPRRVHIYAQRLNSRGKTTWPSGEIPLAPVAGMQFFPQLISDGNGGAIVVWQESRTNWGSDNDIYAQRIGPSGTLLWQSAVAVCTAVGGQERPKIVSDGSGGAIIMWQDNRSGSRYDIYAQRISGNGVPQWTADGIAVSTANNVYPYNLLAEMASDDAGGAIVAWPDKTSGTWKIKAQRVTATGTLAWAADGIAVSAAVTTQYVSRPVTDGSGGAILAWTSSGGDLYAQRIGADGALQWTSDVLVSGADGQQSGPQLTADGDGGAIIAWEDTRAGSEDIYAQRVTASGSVQWAADGVPVCTAPYSQYEPQIISDGGSGAIITWYDYRNYNIMDNGVMQGVDIYAQRLNSTGTAVWPADGAPISTAPLHQMYPKIAADDSGGAIIVWEDDRTGSTVDLYAQGISTSGNQ
jgi:hypothetical protein